MDYSTNNDERPWFQQYRVNNTAHIGNVHDESSKTSPISSTHLGNTKDSFSSDSRNIGIRICEDGQDNSRFRVNSTEEKYHPYHNVNSGHSSQSHFTLASNQPSHINVRNFLDNFEKQYQENVYSSGHLVESKDVIHNEHESLGYVTTEGKHGASSKDYENTPENIEESRMVDQKQLNDQDSDEECIKTEAIHNTDMSTERVVSTGPNDYSTKITIKNGDCSDGEYEGMSERMDKEEENIESSLKKEMSDDEICTDSKTSQSTFQEWSEHHSEVNKEELTHEESLPSGSNISVPKTTPGRKNKRKISNARKRQKSATPNSEMTDVQGSGNALFTMLRKDSGGTMVNITEDNLKAMIEESLKNITKAKNRSQGKAEVDTKNIVEESVKSVTAKVMAQATDNGNQGPSASKKRRKRASPQKLTIQTKNLDIDDVDYNPIMDEDTELEDNEDHTYTEKPKAKTRKRRTRKKKTEVKDKKEEVVDKSENVNSSDDWDVFGDNKVEEESKKKRKKREKKVKVPKEKREKTPKEKKSLICEECGKVFTRNDLLRNHKRCHTGDKPFVCCECGISFREAGHLKRHMTIHTGKKPYKCDICGKELNSSLAKHKRRHLNDRQFPCSLCDKRFVSGFELKQHVQTHLKNEHIPCSICGKTCTNMTILKRHLQSHSDERKYPCQFCPQRFKSKQDCERHQSVHLVTPTCTCHLCGKQFMQERYLKRHIDRHNRPQDPIEIEEPTAEKPYQCDVCFKIFASQANLHQHVSIHLRQGVYGCYICSKTFTQPRYLRRHIKRHQGGDISPEEGEEEEDKGLVWEEEQLSHMVSPMNSAAEAQIKAMKASMQATVVGVAMDRIQSAQANMQATMVGVAMDRIHSAQATMVGVTMDKIQSAQASMQASDMAAQTSFSE